jgi:hypothetical protein
MLLHTQPPEQNGELKWLQPRNCSGTTDASSLITEQHPMAKPVRSSGEAIVALGLKQNLTQVHLKTLLAYREATHLP